MSSPFRRRAEEASGGDAQAGIIELLWGRRQLGARGPKPTLTLDRIAHAAVDIADAEGLSGVSMQRVAELLDVTKMALYRYVASKAELLAIMIEHAVEEPPELERVLVGWRPRLQAYARTMWAVWDRHPWLPGATTGDRAMGPREFAWTESALSALAGTGLSSRERLDAVVLLSGHIRNTRAAGVAGTQPWTGEGQVRLLREHGDRFPNVMSTVLMADGSPQIRVDEARELGLQCILDGLGLLIAQRSPAASRAKRKRPITR